MSRREATKAVSRFARAAGTTFNGALDLLRQTGEVSIPKPVEEAQAPTTVAATPAPDLIETPAESSD